MSSEMNEILNPGSVTRDPAFKHAPSDWSREDAIRAADADGVTLTNDHWELIRALQEYYHRHAETPINLRDLNDALDERFHSRGGRKFLYGLMPGGPIAQGCRIAGLKPPAGAKESGFGSVA